MYFNFRKLMKFMKPKKLRKCETLVCIFIGTEQRLQARYSLSAGTIQPFGKHDCKNRKSKIGYFTFPKLSIGTSEGLKRDVES